MKHLLLAGLLAVGLASCGESATQLATAPAIVIEYTQAGSPQAFAWFLRGAVPAPRVPIVYFYADWCGPCRRFRAALPSAPVQTALRQATIIKVNVDSCQELAACYHVTAVPTFVKVDAQGQPVASITSDKWAKDTSTAIAPVMDKLANSTVYDSKQAK